MNSQVSFMANSELKKKALDKAKREGITLKTILLYSMKAYVDGKIQFGILNERGAEVEEITIKDQAIQTKAQKLANLLKQSAI